MTDVVERKEPELRVGVPVWWHMRGFKMAVSELDATKRTLRITGSAAEIIIRPARSIAPGMDGWYVDWRVSTNKAFEVGGRGRVYLGDDDLKAAFGLPVDDFYNDDETIERYGGQMASRGKFIRWSGYLNIPCPGTGHDGDPNVSIEVDDNMRQAVAQLLG